MPVIVTPTLLVAPQRPQHRRGCSSPAAHPHERIGTFAVSKADLLRWLPVFLLDSGSMAW